MSEEKFIPKELRIQEIFNELLAGKFGDAKRIAQLLLNSPEEGTQALAALQESIGAENEQQKDQVDRELGYVKLILVTAVIYTLSQNDAQAERELNDALMYAEYTLKRDEKAIKLISLINELLSFLA